MATWRDRMKPATFRGVPFFVEGSEHQGGRRNVTHEYPFRDKPYSEDMGRKARRFAVEGYVIGPDYIAARDALLDALEKFGPGSLQHPYYGPRTVAVDDFRVRETQRDGGMAVFSIEFTETPAKPAEPSSVADAASKLRQSGPLAGATAGAEFLAKYSPGILTSSLADMVRAATLAVTSVLGTVEMEEQQLATLKRNITQLGQSAAALVTAPVDLLASVSSVFSLVTSTDALPKIYAFEPGVVLGGSTPNRQKERANFDALHRLIQRSALTQACTLAADQTFDSYDAAMAKRNQLCALLDEQAEIAADDTYPALLQLRADLVNAVPGPGADRARLVSLTPKVTGNSLVLAYDLYGDLSLESDLVARNGVQKPGFILGGQALEVLSRG